MRKRDLAAKIIVGEPMVMRGIISAEAGYDKVAVASVLSDAFWAPGDGDVRLRGVTTASVTRFAPRRDGILIVLADVGVRGRSPLLDDLADPQALAGRLVYHDRGLLVRSSAIIDIAVLGGHQSLVEELYSDREDSIVRGGEATWA